MNFEASTPMHVRRAYMAMHRYAQRHFAAYGVTADQYVMLSVLAEHAPLRQSELVERLDSDPNTVAAMLALLETKSLVKRQPDEADRRARLASLTPQGKRLHEKLIESITPVHAGLKESLGSREAALIKALNQIEKFFTEKSP